MVHGEFRLGNTLCAGEELLAIIDWFHAHARFKQAAITAIQCKLNRKRDVPDPVQESNARLIPLFFASCSEALEQLS